MRFYLNDLASLCVLEWMHSKITNISNSIQLFSKIAGQLPRIEDLLDFASQVPLLNSYLLTQQVL